MQTVDNPKKLFREIDATDLDNATHVTITDPDDPGLLDPSEESVSDEIEEIPFEDLSDPAEDFHASIEALEANAVEVDREAEVPPNVDSVFVTHEGAVRARYFADTDDMGYEFVKSESDPRIAAYVVVSDDALYKVVE